MRLRVQCIISRVQIMVDCEATATMQLKIMKNKIPLQDMTWSVKDINKFVHHPLIHSLMAYDTEYNTREIEFLEHNYSSDSSSL